MQPILLDPEADAWVIQTDNIGRTWLSPVNISGPVISGNQLVVSVIDDGPNVTPDGEDV